MELIWETKNRLTVDMTVECCFIYNLSLIFEVLTIVSIGNNNFVFPEVAWYVAIRVEWSVEY